MSWEVIIRPDKERDMFRLYELYDEKIDDIKYTETEREIIEKIYSESGIE